VCSRTWRKPRQAQALVPDTAAQRTVQSVGRWLFVNGQVEEAAAHLRQFGGRGQVVERLAGDDRILQQMPRDVVGGGPSGLSCSYYLALMGRSVDVYDQGAKSGGKLLQAHSPEDLPPPAVERDLTGILRHGIHFVGGRELGSTLDLQELMRSYNAVYLAAGFTDTLNGYLVSVLGQDWLQGGRSLYPTGGRNAGSVRWWRLARARTKRG
jgi:hypothetical protein